MPTTPSPNAVLSPEPINAPRKPARRPRNPTEDRIDAHLHTWAKSVGAEFRKVRWIGRRGAPDRVIIAPGGRTIWVETKAPGKIAAPHQAREIARFKALGHDVRVISTVDEIAALCL